MMKPTETAYLELQQAYDYFNQHLFDNSLPNCLITLQREKRAYGYFSPERFIKRDGQKTDEIAMNPAYFAICPPEEIMQTLVHEMTHLWQFHFGKPGRRGYHNKEWADKMESLGLMPSSTGKEGGKRTGDSMSDYIIKDSLFDQMCQSLLTSDFRISWADKYPVREKIQEAIENGTIEDISDELEVWGVEIIENEDGEIIIDMPEPVPTRHKYSCPQCAVNVWGKPTLNLVCGDCQINFIVID